MSTIYWQLFERQKQITALFFIKIPVCGRICVEQLHRGMGRNRKTKRYKDGKKMPIQMLAKEL
jgi:hypothetical protein